MKVYVRSISGGGLVVTSCVFIFRGKTTWLKILLSIMCIVVIIRCCWHVHVRSLSNNCLALSVYFETWRKLLGVSWCVVALRVSESIAVKYYTVVFRIFLNNFWPISFQIHHQWPYHSTLYWKNWKRGPDIYISRNCKTTFIFLANQMPTKWCINGLFFDKLVAFLLV
jgi:hypothetical protein